MGSYSGYSGVGSYSGVIQEWAGIPSPPRSDAALPDSEGAGGWHLRYGVPGQDHRQRRAGGHQEVSYITA